MLAFHGAFEFVDEFLALLDIFIPIDGGSGGMLMQIARIIIFFFFVLTLRANVADQSIIISKAIVVT